ncbi:GAF domain-containing SpoIIE family protein phosphatase [Amycolatopsis sp. NPDC049688]|uniref:PP2C family protein-serine/threonine phosphatase n=1 Tax=Amycolatopsis sp. NPDC049688 TaxID=3154733 RepID=UPI00342F5C17
MPAPYDDTSTELFGEIVEIARRPGTSPPLRETLSRIRAALKVDTATVLLAEGTADYLAAAAAVGIEEEVHQGVRVPVGRGFAGRIAQQRKPVVLDHVDETSVVNSLLWERGLTSMLGVPMLAGSALVGVLHVGSVEHREFTDAEIVGVQLVAERLAYSVQLAELRRTRTTAVQLQRSLLPGPPAEVRGLRAAARYVGGAAIGLGGDWYDLFPLPHGLVGVVAGDVAGQGLEAAVIMGRLRSVLRAYALDNDDPADVLGKLDREATHFEIGAMATVAYGVIDQTRERMTLSLAGHPAPVLASGDQPGRLVAAPIDPPIGVTVAEKPRRATQVALPAGSVLAFYTDGLVKGRRRAIDQGMRELENAVTAADPERVCTRAMARLIGSTEPEDDVALLVVQRQ